MKLQDKKRRQQAEIKKLEDTLERVKSKVRVRTSYATAFAPPPRSAIDSLSVSASRRRSNTRRERQRRSRRLLLWRQGCMMV